MENQESKLFYCEKVDLTMQTYIKALKECLAELSQQLMICATYDSQQLQELINLIFILNNQINAVDKFLKDYSKLKESV